MQFKRLYKISNQSAFLLGPRGTGKSTFVRDIVKPDYTIDLLKTSDYRLLQNNPSELETIVGHLKENKLVFIDEIQKVPDLLDEVHRLIESKKIKFILSGSSARKLKRYGNNLLGGRALLKRMYPLTIKEMQGEISIEDIILRGQLPLSINSLNQEYANEFLYSYVETYLKEEINQEAVVRNLNDFSKFIELAGQYHAQILNYENIARSLGLSGDTIKSWFKILEDTLISYEVEAIQFGCFARETKHSKFYLFDCGVARAAEGLNSLTDFPEKRGFYFETIILNELRAYLEIKGLRYKIFYYNVPSVGDIDFVVEIQKKSLNQKAKYVTLEIKYSKKWDNTFEKMQNHLVDFDKKKFVRNIAIYLGERRLTKKKTEVFPVNDFVESLWAGDLF